MGLSQIVEPIVNSMHNVIGIIECAPRRKDKKLKKIKYSFVRNIYNLIKHKKTISLSSFSNKQNIPYYYMNNGSDSKLEEWVSKLEPDLIVIYSMSQLLKRNIFSIPRYGTINLHPSLLPKYRGPNPWFWMYYNMENEGGVTIHYIDEGEDTGDIIYQKSYQIEPGMRLPEMQEIAINKIGVGLLLKTIDDISNGKAPRIKQTIKNSTKRARNIELNEHEKIINWQNWKIERIWHLLRGTENWLNTIEQSKGIYKGQGWRILNYKKQKMKKMQVSKIYKEQNKYFIACKDGKIYIDEKVRPLIGITLCGYNLSSLRTWGKPKHFDDLNLYVPMLKYLLNNLNANVFLLPHVYRTNPYIHSFDLINGPDYDICLNLYQLMDREDYKGRLKIIEGKYTPSEAKGIIGQCDMYISGRIHAGVAALSQGIPTVLIAYGHKHYGFANLLHQEKYVFGGNSSEELASIIKDAWSNREEIAKVLKTRMVRMEELVNLNFEIVKEIINFDKDNRNHIPKEISDDWIKKGEQL